MEKENIVEQNLVEENAEQTLENSIQEESKQENAELQNDAGAKAKSTAGIWRKITSIALLVLASIIMIGVVLMSTVKKDFNYGFNAPQLVTLHTESTSNINNGATLTKGTDVYNKFMTLYNDSFKTTLFGAMFQGKLGAGVTAKEGYKSLSSLSGTYVEFFYTEAQSIKIAGKQYDATIVSNTNYISIIIEVKNTTSFDEISAYFKYRDTGTNNYSYIRFVSYASQANLYDFVENGEL